MNRKDRIEGQLRMIEIVGKRIDQLESENERLREALVGIINRHEVNDFNIDVCANKALSQDGGL